MSGIIAEIAGEGFAAVITFDEPNVIRFLADADIDADGANGQHGKRPAYTVKDDGSEFLANGGMGRRGGKVVFTRSWGPDIAVANALGEPVVTPEGAVVTKTAYRFRDRHAADPAAYVDSETVPYVVVPPIVIRSVVGVVLGCQAFASYRGKRVAAVVADVGPRNKVGEISIELARRLGIQSSPRYGGLSTAEVQYEILAGEKAVVDEVTYALHPWRG